MHTPKMLGVCMRYTNNKDAAEDMLQEGFIKVFTKIDAYSGEGSFAGWVHRIFVTTALESLRQQNVLKFAVNIEDYKESFESINDSAIDNISNEDLMACISKLSEGYRTVFNLYAIEGYSHAEIALELQITEGTSRSQFARARKILQESIQSLYGRFKK